VWHRLTQAQGGGGGDRNTAIISGSIGMGADFFFSLLICAGWLGKKKNQFNKGGGSRKKRKNKHSGLFFGVWGVILAHPILTAGGGGCGCGPGGCSRFFRGFGGENGD